MLPADAMLACTYLNLRPELPSRGCRLPHEALQLCIQLRLGVAAQHFVRPPFREEFAEILSKIFNLCTAEAMPSNIVDQAWSRMDAEMGKSRRMQADPQDWYWR